MISAYAERLCEHVQIIRVGKGCDGWGKKPDIRVVAHRDHGDPAHAILKAGEKLAGGKQGSAAHLTAIAKCLIAEGYGFASWERYDQHGKLVRSIDRVPLTKFTRKGLKNAEEEFAEA